MVSLESDVELAGTDQLERLTVLEAAPARPLALLLLERAVQPGEAFRCELRGVGVERAVLARARGADVDPDVGRGGEIEAQARERVGLEAPVELGVAAREPRQAEEQTRLG